MMLARVVGRVWATMKNDSLEGKKMLVIQPVDVRGRPTGKPLVAVDAVGAGAAELVYWCRGREASFAWIPGLQVPTEAAVVGIVDEVHV